MTDSKQVMVNLPLNRAEGDLEIRVAMANGQVVDAWSRGTLFRGFERIMVGRAPLDALVITPRICGICSMTHLLAAARALDDLAGATPPDQALRLRNVAIMAEITQSDVRQSVLMFLVDCVNPAYETHSMFHEARARYTPVGVGAGGPPGERYLDTIRASKRFLEIVAMLGGQWPHTSFMVPGGVVSTPSNQDLLKCRQVLLQLWQWYEQKVLGCPISRWQEVASGDELAAWLMASPDHRQGDVGFLLRFGREAGWERLGRGHQNFLSFGSLELPAKTRVVGSAGQLIPAGFARDGQVESFTAEAIAEHTAFSWYHGSGLHPRHGEIDPLASGDEGRKYSWVKAPRYQGQPAETGPLAEGIIGGDPLLRDLLAREGANVLTRQLARLIRPARMLPVMLAWIDEMLEYQGDPYYLPPANITSGEGVGLIQAARGALGHWLTVEDGRISSYQIITPTGWNGSPRDDAGIRGPWEEALIGVQVRNLDHPVEIGHVVRSFDPCLVCAVHALGRGDGPWLRI